MLVSFPAEYIRIYVLKRSRALTTEITESTEREKGEGKMPDDSYSIFVIRDSKVEIQPGDQRGS
jgi:hypothetical protein